MTLLTRMWGLIVIKSQTNFKPKVSHRKTQTVRLNLSKNSHCLLPSRCMAHPFKKAKLSSMLSKVTTGTRSSNPLSPIFSQMTTLLAAKALIRLIRSLLWTRLNRLNPLNSIKRITINISWVGWIKSQRKWSLMIITRISKLLSLINWSASMLQINRSR